MNHSRWSRSRAVAARIAAGSRENPLLAAGALAVLAGAAVRVHAFAFARSLWLDEAMLALNVAARTFAELARPLDYNQAAPILFLWMQKACVSMLGVSEPALRLVPMLAGLAVPLVAWRFGHTIFGRTAGVVAAVLAAGSPALVRYSNEAKPYGVDALVALALVAAAWSLRAAPSKARAARLGLIGAVALLVSFPALFVCGAVAAWGLLDRAARRHAATWLALGVWWALVAGAAYALLYSVAARSAYQQECWAYAFLVPRTLTFDQSRLAWRGTVLPPFLGIGSSIPDVPDAVAAVLTLALAAGLLVAARRHGAATAVLLGGPLLLAITASALRRYPIGVPRMMMFAAPFLILLAAGAAGALLDAVRGRALRAVATAVLIAIVALPVLARAAETRAPFRGEDAATLVAAFRDRPRREEPVYVNARGVAAWVFYTTNWRRPHRGRLEWYARQAAGPAFENAPPRPAAVGDEGDDLVYEWRGHREIVGLSTGRQWRWPSYATPGPDAGWARNEARRVASEANPCAWLFFTRMSEGVYKPLKRELLARGARQHILVTATGGLVVRFCMPYPRALESRAPQPDKSPE